MRFSIFSSVKAAKGELCTSEKFWSVAEDPKVKDICLKIENEKDPDKRGELKKQLPIITWQAFFPGKRVAKEAQPSGLFMLDFDHLEEFPYTVYRQRIAGHTKEWGIVLVHMTPSTKGLRVVAKCRPEFSTLAECQKWLAEQIGLPYDSVCKDFARSSFMVPTGYLYYTDGKMFTDEPENGTVYAIEAKTAQVNADIEDCLDNLHVGPDADELEEAKKNKDIDQREGLFGGKDEYKGVPYERIIKEWLQNTGGEPTEGERNTRLYQLALRLRYITDFNAAIMFRVMPRYGLPVSETKEIISHALTASRAARMPQDLSDTLEKIDKQIKLGGSVEEPIDEDEIITSTDKMPPLPPIFKEWCEIAPEDFKRAVVLCQLPILGTLGSRLRAEYLDGRVHSPSFQVSLEAPQASGKSFLTRLVDYELAQLKEDDERARAEERDYQEKMSKLKLLNVKVKKGDSSEIPEKPRAIVRYVPATMSITKLLMRMSDAQGLHLFALAEEIDTVLKAFKRGFSSFSDALRVSFDNGEYGQDYASDQSFSGMVRLYYNALFSGTPKAMCRFYPDVEDGLVSRVLFCTLPDQFGKPMPIWGTFNKEQKRAVDIGLVRLNEVTLQGSEVQPEHHMKMAWLNKHLQQWICMQQQEALRQEDRTRDIFCRRAAVVGFRAGMLAWFLYGEVPTPTIRRKVCEFSVWVANCMLNQHILRFNVQTAHSNINPWEAAYKRLGDEFTREELQQALEREGINTRPRMVIYKWRLLGIIETVEAGTAGARTRDTQTKFRKIKK